MTFPYWTLSFEKVILCFCFPSAQGTRFSCFSSMTPKTSTDTCCLKPCRHAGQSHPYSSSFVYISGNPPNWYSLGSFFDGWCNEQDERWMK